jgi:hypothetical protein
MFLDKLTAVFTRIVAPAIVLIAYWALTVTGHLNGQPWWLPFVVTLGLLGYSAVTTLLRPWPIKK